MHLLYSQTCSLSSWILLNLAQLLEGTSWSVAKTWFDSKEFFITQQGQAIVFLQYLIMTRIGFIYNNPDPHERKSTAAYFYLKCIFVCFEGHVKFTYSHVIQKYLCFFNLKTTQVPLVYRNHNILVFPVNRMNKTAFHIFFIQVNISNLLFFLKPDRFKF